MVSKNERLNFCSPHLQRVQYSHWTFRQLIPEVVNLYVFKYALVLWQHSGNDYFIFHFVCPNFFFLKKDLTPALARLTLMCLPYSESRRSLSSFLHEGCPQINWGWSCKAMLIVIGGSKRADAQQGNLRNGWTRRGDRMGEGDFCFKGRHRSKICPAYKIGPGSGRFNDEANYHWLSGIWKAMWCV